MTGSICSGVFAKLLESNESQNEKIHHVGLLTIII
jgi:hypothetical protein